MKLISVNPYTEEILQELETLTLEEGAPMILRSRQAFLFWNKASVRERSRYLLVELRMRVSGSSFYLDVQRHVAEISLGAKRIGVG